MVITLALNGCWVSRLAVNSIWDSISDTPQKVTKLINPLLDSVRISVLWAGHSTSLVQIYDKVIIFDPFFNKRFNGILLRKKNWG